MILFRNLIKDVPYNCDANILDILVILHVVNHRLVHI